MILALLVLPSGELLAQAATDGGRDELQAAYKAQLADSPSFFASAPVYHIIPKDNTITFAGDIRTYDVTVAPVGVDISESRSDLDERFDVSGYSASPYVAFQAKNFGFGFTGSVGKRAVHYLRKGTGYAEHLGVAKYSGIGANASLSPPWKFIPKFVKPTLIVGATSMNVVQTSSGELVEAYSAVEMKKYQYAAFNYAGGFNISLNLVKRFTVIPWIDYSSYGFSKPKASAGGTADEAADAVVASDAELFWKSAPPLTYGIDFAVRIIGLDVHLGGLMGILGTLNKGSDRIQDHSRSVSVSFDVKGG